MITSTFQIPSPVIITTQSTGIITTQSTGSHPEVSRLLAAAVVNRQFRHLLLSDPIQALDEGYQGEEFAFTRNEYDLIFSIQAESLSELAEQLISSLGISAYSDQYDTRTETQRIYKTQ